MQFYSSLRGNNYYLVNISGTVVTIEGPRFSTKAESRMFRQWGGDVINMTTVPEVCLLDFAYLNVVNIGFF